MKTLGNKVYQIPEKEQDPEIIELGTTPLHPQLEKFFKKWGNDYQPKYAEDEPTTVYDDGGRY